MEGTVKREPHSKRSHVNKYAHLAISRVRPYDPFDKTYRTLPVSGAPGEIIQKGLRVLFHGRMYGLQQSVVIPRTGQTLADFRLLGFID